MVARVVLANPTYFLVRILAEVEGQKKLIVGWG